MSNIVCVTPTIRPDCHAKFVAAWGPLFREHDVTLVTVWDGDDPVAKVCHEPWVPDPTHTSFMKRSDLGERERRTVCRHTDGCRNLGFLVAADLDPDFVLTLDDDCYPVRDEWVNQNLPIGGYGRFVGYKDPIKAHLNALTKRYPVSWFNTAHNTDLYLRGFPERARVEAPAHLSHGVWVGTPDFDGETQLALEANGGVPLTLPYYVGPVPRGASFPLCGMNVMVTRTALPYLYYAPMGPDSGCEHLHRFADIFMGATLKGSFDDLGWACVTGYSTVHHTRASNARKNFEAEKLGREWLEMTYTEGPDAGRDAAVAYAHRYQESREDFAAMISSKLLRW